MNDTLEPAPAARSPISFNVPERLWQAFHDQTDGLFLARSRFLDHILARELPHVREDLQGWRMSTRAKRLVAGEFKRLDSRSVNIELRLATAQDLRDTLVQHNLVRDAFFTRVILLLRSTDRLLDLLEVPRYASDRLSGGILEDMPASPLLAMEAVRDDPLYYVRHFVRERHGVGLYQLQLPFLWASCYLDDEVVPGTAAAKRANRIWDEIAGVPTPIKARRRPAAGRR
ncbi:hypothetical protein PE066_19110 [Ramlibacter tataouinensis]|uniref:hypothetical protein n=1 Tax=Ramlibacter tataouinensis TaxID=94132 RepID=UPI0022F3EC83|nr:hypothetical protein [Ramlibacter tataouinensis]WBY01548.1 hypothetical protein PE066_19110 [Ramlibacter tataouinensis]